MAPAPAPATATAMAPATEKEKEEHMKPVLKEIIIDTVECTIFFFGIIAVLKLAPLFD